MELCPLSRILGGNSPQKPRSSPTIGSWSNIQYRALISVIGTDLKSIHKAVGDLYNIFATIAPMGMSCPTSHCCSSYGSQLGKAVVDFYLQHLLVVAELATRKKHPGHHQTDFSTSCDQNRWCLLNRLLPSGSGGNQEQ